MQGNLFLYKQRFALRRCLQARHCDPCSSTISCPQPSIHLGQKSAQCLCKTPPPIQASCSWRKNRFFIADVSIHLPHNIWLRHPNGTTTWFVIVCGEKIDISVLMIPVRLNKAYVDTCGRDTCWPGLFPSFAFGHLLCGLGFL